MLSMNLFAQNDSNITILQADTTPDIPDYKMTRIGTSLLFGFNSYGNEYKGTNKELNSFSSRSTSVGLRLKARFSQESRWYMNVGLELGWNNYMLIDSNRVAKTDNSVYFYTDTINFRKSKFTRTMLTIPLLLEYNSSLKPKKNGFKFGIGPYIGFRIKGYERYTYNLNWETVNNRTKNDLNLNGTSIGIMAMLGADNIALFIRNDFSQLFRKDLQPNIKTFTWGLVFQ